MGIGTRAHRIIAIIQISIVTIRIMHAISILYSSLCSLNAAMKTMALTSAIMHSPFHNHESSCINCIVVTSFLEFGITPTYVGKSTYSSCEIKCQQDHSRVWKKETMALTSAIMPRITPTCVGKGLKIIPVTFVRISHIHL